MNDSILSHETILPADFDGVFRFTNWTDEEFVGVWGKKEYHFPAVTTSPMIMPDCSPLEIQYIRKKFAKDLGEREFFKSAEYNKYKRQERNDDGTAKLNSIHQAGTYTDSELAPFIQRCLEPLSVSRAVVTEAAGVTVEEKLSRNEEGELNSEAIDKKASLRDKALKA